MRIEIDGLAWLPKAELTDDNISWLKDQLTLKQKISKEYERRSKGAIVELFKDDSERLGIPREFFFDKLTKNHEISYSVSRGQAWPERKVVPELAEVSGDDPTELLFYDVQGKTPLQLRAEQITAVDSMMLQLSSRPAAGGIIQSGTGTGKTILSFEVIRRLRLKTGVLVHREFVLNQWKKRLEQYMPDTKVGVIAGDTYQVEDCHVVLISIQTIVSWIRRNKITDELRNMFGLMISEECHRSPAPSWSAVIPIFNAAYRMGISAAPKRSDGLDKILFYHIGPKVYSGTTVLVPPKVRRVWSNYRLNHPRFNPSLMSMEHAFKIMSADPVYNQDVVDQIKLALKAERKIFVYSHTVKHLQLLRSEIESQWKERQIKIDYFIGGMTEDELAEAETADLIFGTFKMAIDSLDIPALDTIVLAGPIRNPQQPAGRACRPFPNKKQPIVVDMRADNVPVFRDYAESRDKAYQRLYGDDFLTKAKT